MSPASTRFKRWFFSRENAILGRQRLLFFASVALIGFVLTAGSLLTVPKRPILQLTASLTLVSTVILVHLYWLRKLRIRWAAAALYIILQLALSVQKLSLAFDRTPESAGFILQGSFLSLLLIMVSILSLLRYAPTIISAISMFTFCCCVIIFPSKILHTFAPVYLIVLLGVIIYDMTSIRPLLNIEDSKHAKHGFSDSVLTLSFPDLTPTQVAICQLALQGKKHAEICHILHKSVTQISTQSSQIRTVLGIPQDVPLKEALEHKLGIDHQA